MTEKADISVNNLFNQKILRRNTENGDLELDCNLLKEVNSEAYDYFIKNPEEWFEETKQQIKEILEVSPEKKDAKGNLVESSTLPKNILNYKIINFRQEVSISFIRNENNNKIYKLKGIIKRTTKVVPRTIKIIYECFSCGSNIAVTQEGREKKSPIKCSCGRKGGFKMRKEEITNIQEISLEEMPEETAGKQPNQIRVYLEGDLTDPNITEKLQPGRRIEVIGIIKKIPPFMTKKDEEENISDFMLNAINIAYLDDDDNMFITEEDIEQIKEISRGDPLKYLSENLSPSIYGHDLIKNAIILQLVKGVKKPRPDGTFTRGDIHILLSGDPGQAKTVLLKATSLRSPNSRYVSGTRSSGVGLTCSLRKDELLNSWALEAGVMVLSSGSLICVDEVDKMDKEQQASLYEPLETQTVSISKAGINATLRSETSVLAAANPIRGKFDLYQPIASQIDLPSPLLNRFDLIFILLDKRDEIEDKKAFNHLFGIHQGITNNITNPILFKKYISYARKLTPYLTEETKQTMEKIYLKVRRKSGGEEKGGVSGVPINMRNAEAMIRLAEAHAKIRLSPKVENIDVNVAEKIFMFSLKQTGFDEESGKLDMSRITEKVPVSKRGKMEYLLEMIHNLSAKLGKEIPYHEIIENCKNYDIQKWELDSFLEQLNREGRIIEPRTGIYQVV